MTNARARVWVVIILALLALAFVTLYNVARFYGLH